MCGIVAFWGRDAFAPEPVLRALVHRGPDGEGVWSYTLPDGRSVHLGHRRLAILDLSPNGAQPMRDEVTGNVIVFNGEIYNFAQLRRELETMGHAFSSTGDTEVLLKGYAAWGIQALCRRLDGIFAFVVFDSRRRVLVVARDHLGIKPLYQIPVDGGWMLASESRAIIRSGQVRCDIDVQSVADYLHFGAMQEPYTLFLGMRSFPPGSWAEVSLDDPGDATRLEARPFWLPERVALEGKGGDVAGHTAELRRTVNEQLVSDVPLGVFLSAGVDSTVLLEMIHPDARRRVKAFTLSGRVAENDEAALAAETCKNLGVRHEVVRLEDGQVGGWVREGLDAMDQPTADAINTYLVSRASKTTDIKVALSGTGADELHGGYDHYVRLATLDRWLRRLGSVGGGLLGLGAALYRFRDRTTAERMSMLLQRADSPWSMLYEKRRYFTQRQVAQYWPAGGSSSARWEAPYRDSSAYAGLDFHTQLAIAEFHCFLRSMLLRDCDWATMANGQELRVPYLGRRYVELALQLSWKHKLPAGGCNKPLLSGLVSAENRAVILRRKTGFHIQYGSLLQHDFRGDLAEVFGALNTQLGFRIDTAQVLERLSRSPEARFSRRMWALFALGWFVRRHF